MNDMSDRARPPRYGWLLVIALIAGLSFYATGWIDPEPGPLVWLWKGAGVGLLACWAALQARSFDGWLIAFVLAAGAAGDMLLDAVSLTSGAIAFLIGHVAAILLYLRNRRPSPSVSQWALAIILVPASVAIAWLLPTDRAEAPGIAVYALAVSAMAATAWLSRFARYRVGIGAVLFVVSDLLIFARMGPLAGSFLPNLLIWPLYFLGQAMIAIGVVQTLHRDAGSV